MPLTYACVWLHGRRQTEGYLQFSPGWNPIVIVPADKYASNVRLLLVFVFLRGFCIKSAGIPTQLETDPDQVAFLVGQVIAKDSHCYGKPYVECLPFSQVGSFIFHLKIIIECAKSCPLAPICRWIRISDTETFDVLANYTTCLTAKFSDCMMAMFVWAGVGSNQVGQSRHHEQQKPRFIVHCLSAIGSCIPLPFYENPGTPLAVQAAQRQRSVLSFAL